MSDLAVPNPGALVNGLVDELKARFVGYLLAGTGYFAAIFASVFVLIAVFAIGAIPGAVTENETLLSIGILVSGLLFYTPGILFVTLVMGPAMNASLMRAIWSARREDAPLGFGSAFGSVRENLRDVVIVTVLYQLAVFVGMLFCYVPGIVLAVMFVHAMPLVVLHGVTPMDALKMSFEKVKENGSYHAIAFVLMFVVVMVCEFIPLVGLLLLIPVQLTMLLMMYEAMFGPNGPAEARAAA